MTANTTRIEPKICAYCQQEQVYQEGVGHLPHTHKPMVTNKAGEPYAVAWDDHYCALVFHPNDIEHYRVLVSEGGDFTCRGKSDGSRCWPFYQQAHCVHCEATQASIDCGERPALPVPTKRQCWHDGGDCDERSACCNAGTDQPQKPVRKERTYTLESLFEEPLTATEQRRAAQFQRVYGK